MGTAVDFDPKHRVGHLLRRAYHRAKSSANALLRSQGITPMQAAAMMTLHTAGTLSQAELGRAIGMEAANVHGLVARLKKAKLVELSADKDDSRKVSVSLSASGERRAARIAELTAQAAEATLEIFAPQERNEFLALLSRYALEDDG